MLNRWDIIIRGFFTGMLLQVAVGPLFFFIVNLTLTTSFSRGLQGILGVTLGDYIFIILAVLGAGKWGMSRNRLPGLLSALVLVVFGGIILKGAFSSGGIIIPEAPGVPFWGALILTLSSPLTIVFWSGIFTAKALEYELKPRDMIFFGIGAGLATPVFLSLAAAGVSLVGELLSPLVIKGLNGIAGGVLIFYGILRGVKIFRKTVK